MRNKLPHQFRNVFSIAQVGDIWIIQKNGMVIGSSIEAHEAWKQALFRAESDWLAHKIRSQVLLHSADGSIKQYHLFEENGQH